MPQAERGHFNWPKKHTRQILDPGVLSDRFWERVEPGPPSECWLWRGSVGEAGYGSIERQINGRRSYLKAHRVAWFLAHAEWPEAFVCHKCDNTRCVNPSHLFVGSPKDNIRDAMAKGRFRLPPRFRGETTKTAKLNRAQISEIRRRCSSGETQDSVRREFGISASHISRIVNRQSWAWL